MSMSTSSTMPTARCAAIWTNSAVVSSRSSLCKVRAVATSSGRASSCSGSSRKDYYKVLSLEHSAAVGAEEIKRAYRRLALRYHPDLCPPSRRAEFTELFLELRRAYETLSDPARRVRYDAELRTVGGEASSPRVEFARDVWEAQLCALRARSELRQRQREREGCGHSRSD